MTIVEFTARGSNRALAAAIEELATERRVVNALVVPWECDATTVRMAVTATKADGWAIEHTNLGTVALDDLGSDLTRVVVTAESGSDASSMIVAFARQIERKLAPAPADAPGTRQ